MHFRLHRGDILSAKRQTRSCWWYCGPRPVRVRVPGRDTYLCAQPSVAGLRRKLGSLWTVIYHRNLPLKQLFRCNFYLIVAYQWVPLQLVSRAAAKHTTVAKRKCTTGVMADDSDFGVGVATGTVGRRPWESYAPACSGAEDAVASCPLPLRQ